MYTYGRAVSNFQSKLVHARDKVSSLAYRWLHERVKTTVVDNDYVFLLELNEKEQNCQNQRNYEMQKAYLQCHSI